MSNVSEWNTSAASNNSAAPNGAPEGMAPSGVNDTMREMMAAVARWYQDTDGGLVTAGSSNAYTLTTNNDHAALADQSFLIFRADRANTGTATLNVDSLGAKSIQCNGAALVSGQIVQDAIYIAVYNSEDDAYDLIGAFNASATNLTTGTLPDARLSSNVPLKDTENVFSREGVRADAALQIITSATNAGIYLKSGGATTDEKGWTLDALSTGNLRLGTASDADAFGAAIINVDRTGTTVDKVNITATQVQANGSNVLTEADEGSGNGIDADTVDGIEGAALRDATINTQDGNYTLVLTDAGKTIYKSAGDAGETITIPANSSVAFPTGTMVTIVNQGGGDLSIAITTDTLTQAGTGSTGTRTLADDGMATILKVTTTSWMISGTGLS